MKQVLCSRVGPCRCPAHAGHVALAGDEEAESCSSKPLGRRLPTLSPPGSQPPGELTGSPLGTAQIRDLLQRTGLQTQGLLGTARRVTGCAQAHPAVRPLDLQDLLPDRQVPGAHGAKGQLVAHAQRGVASTSDPQVG